MKKGFCNKKKLKLLLFDGAFDYNGFLRTSGVMLQFNYFRVSVSSAAGIVALRCLGFIFYLFIMSKKLFAQPVFYLC